MMKKIAKTLFMALAATAVSGAFAGSGPAKITIAFSADPVKYADGTTLSKGEWCALCWSPNAEFGGMDSNCEPLVAGDRVVRVRSGFVNDDGSIGPVIYVVRDSEVPEDGGNYFVYALDTRTNGTVASEAAGNVKGAVLATTATVSGSTSGASSCGNAVADNSFDPVLAPNETLTQARITNIDLSDKDDAVLTVEGVYPTIRYNVQFGKALDKIETVTLEPKVGNSERLTFSVPKEDANFFRVVRD